MHVKITTGKASAMAVIVLILCLAISFIYKKVLGYEET